MNPERNEEKAIEHLHSLHDLLQDCGYTDKERGMILTRLLLCFFAERTAVFGQDSFFRVLETEDGRTPAERLNRVFSALGGWLILHQMLSLKELCGAGLMFIAVILASLS